MHDVKALAFKRMYIYLSLYSTYIYMYKYFLINLRLHCNCNLFKKQATSLESKKLDWKEKCLAQLRASDNLFPFYALKFQLRFQCWAKNSKERMGLILLNQEGSGFKHIRILKYKICTCLYLYKKLQTKLTFCFNTL